MEVSSSSRVRDLCEGIASRLQLASWDGCSLFIKITDKVSYLAGQGGNSARAPWLRRPRMTSRPQPAQKTVLAGPLSEQLGLLA